MASAVTSISENKMAASMPSRSTGSMVTSAASSGVLHISKNEYLFLISQYSFIKRPAWRIIQTGGRSVFSENAAFINNESLIFVIRTKSRDSRVKKIQILVLDSRLLVLSLLVF